MKKVKDIIRLKIKEISEAKRLRNKRIFVFGYNVYTEYINNFLHDEGYMLYGVVDNDKKKQGRKIYDVFISAPQSIKWGKDDIVLIACIHEKSMTEQIRSLSKETAVISLIDFLEYTNKWREEEEFWRKENYVLEVKRLNQGEEVYKNLKSQKPMVIFPTNALGDMFIGGLYLHGYMEKIKADDIKIIVTSKSTEKIARLFGSKDITVITKNEIDVLVKYVIFCGLKDIAVYNWTMTSIASYKNNTFPEYWKNYIFNLDKGCQNFFPSIWDNHLTEEKLRSKGMIKGKSVILSPFANSIDELPWQFWNILTRRLLEKGYVIFTNISGNQRPVEGSIGLEIPLEQVGNYLEFAGQFISLRSGLCDIAGHSQCKQIIIYRNRNSTYYSSEIEFFDLHAENVSKNAIQYVYNDNKWLKNIDVIIDLLLNSN